MPAHALVLYGRNVAFEAAAAAIELLGQQDKVDPSEFCAVLDNHVVRVMDEAVSDAGMAWDGGFHVVAQVTFDASMRLAGVRAAKEVLGL
jgi:hypothetical protein